MSKPNVQVTAFICPSKFMRTKDINKHRHIYRSRGFKSKMGLMLHGLSRSFMILI